MRRSSSAFLVCLITLSSPLALGHSPEPGRPRRPAGSGPARIVRSDSGSIVSTFAGNARHTAIFEPAAQDMNRIRWTIFFGFRVQGTAPAPLNTTQSGFARVGAGGAGVYVLAGAAANDPAITLDSHRSAPALSNDESTLYVTVKSSQTEFYA